MTAPVTTQAGIVARMLRLADALVLGAAVSKPRRTPARWAIRAWWFLRGHGAERELALRWRKPRYRLMVADEPGDEHFEWSHTVNGKRIPICTRAEGERRKARFVLTHPGCSARVERIRRADR